MIKSELNNAIWFTVRFTLFIFIMSIICSLSAIGIGHFLPNGVIVAYQTMDAKVYVIDVERAISTLLTSNALIVPSSSNGCQPVFIRQLDNANIYAWDLITNNYSVPLQATASYIAWHSDEHNVAYELRGDIYLARVGNGGTSNLTASLGNLAYFPAWSPDGQQLVFSSSDNEGWGVFIMNADGSNLRRLSDANFRLDRQPSNFRWSSDGLQIFFIINYNPSGPEASLYTLDVASGTVHQLVNHLVQFGMDWSDGVVYGGENMNATDIFTFDPFQANPPQNLTADAPDDANPAWSPDSQQIAFLSQRESIFVMNRNGSNLRRLATHSELANNQTPVWENSCP